MQPGVSSHLNFNSRLVPSKVMLLLLNSLDYFFKFLEKNIFEFQNTQLNPEIQTFYSNHVKIFMIDINYDFYDFLLFDQTFYIH